MRPLRSPAALLVAVTVASCAGDAAAFCRARACGAPGEPPCGTTADGCPANGAPLRWPSACIPYAVTTTGSARRGIDAGALRDVVQRAFARWRSVDCGEGRHPSFDVVDAGPSRWDRHDGKDGENAFVFADDTFRFDPALFAVTAQRWDTGTGAIRDADVVLDSLDHALALHPATPADVALDGVVTHEVGHFLGLAHANVPSALMAESYEPSDAPTLSPDDVRGICALFPSARASPDVPCVAPSPNVPSVSPPAPEVASPATREAPPSPAAPRTRSGLAAVLVVGLGAACGLALRRRSHARRRLRP